MVTIYGIENLINGKHYIGCTAGRPQKRWREHRCLLRAGKHVCQELQSDWNEMGESHFRIRSIYELFYVERITVEIKREYELHFMDQFDAEGKLYKQNRLSFQPPPGSQAKAVAESARIKRETGWKQSPESNLKRRLAQLGIPKGHGAKISATKQARKNI